MVQNPGVHHPRAGLRLELLRRPGAVTAYLVAVLSLCGQPGLVEPLFLDSFESGLVFRGGADGWQRARSLSIGLLPSEDREGAYCLLPGGHFDWDGNGYSQNRTLPVNESGSAWVFEWVLRDFEVNVPSSAEGHEADIHLGLMSSQENRQGQLTLWHSAHGGAVITLRLNGNAVGETSLDYSLYAADESNSPSSSSSLVAAASGTLDPMKFGQVDGEWTQPRLSVRLRLANPENGEHAFRLMISDGQGILLAEHEGTLSTGTEFDSGAFLYFSVQRRLDAQIGLCFEQVQIWREPEEGMAFVEGRVFEDGNRNGIQDLGEMGIPGVGIDVIKAGESQQIETRDDGYYSTAVLPGSYQLRVNPPDGYLRIANDLGDVDTIDSDFASDTGLTPIASLAAGESIVQDAGLRLNLREGVQNFSILYVQDQNSEADEVQLRWNAVSVAARPSAAGESERIYPSFQLQKSLTLDDWDDAGDPIPQRTGGLEIEHEVVLPVPAGEAHAYFRVLIGLDLSLP